MPRPSPQSFRTCGGRRATWPSISPASACGRAPIELDVDQPWPTIAADSAFSANPFHYGGQPTSQSNARFDAMLRARDPSSGIRDFEHIQTLAARHGVAFLEDNAMPANNRLLVFRKQS